MFKCSNKTTDQNLFSSINQFLTGKSLNIYEDTKEWHNQFRQQVTDRIDEEIFRPLFCPDNGAPNAPIRILVSMMVLKESCGLSDSQLFEACRFNLLYRKALGLSNIDDSLPAESTYYLLRKHIVGWEKAGNNNLIELCFKQITKSQIIEFHVNGKKIRMDSKLLGSNIAWYSRYELIHETVRKAYRSLKSGKNSLLLNESEITLLENIIGESGDKVSYRSNKSEIDAKLLELGVVIYKIINQIGACLSDELQLLVRVFGEQYLVTDGVVCPRAKEEISADSVQSPHDPDCTYRQKNDNQIKGFSMNVTETCDNAQPLNLVTDVIVDVASVADNKFLKPAIESTKQQTGCQSIKSVNSDGAYHSVENQDYCNENDIDLILSGIQGKDSRYDLFLDNNGELLITDLQTSTVIPCRKVKSRKPDVPAKWSIRGDKGNYRYFTQQQIDTCSLRKQIAARSKEELNVRNNVEATIFQLGYHYPNNKSRYRGLSKHRIWANLRCIWVNFMRILKFLSQNGSNFVESAKNQRFLPQFLAKFVATLFVMCFFKKNRLILQKNEH
ncbi:MAG: transposase [Bacteroidales bacterium]|jgi:hypothetical protein|nr:transposase [Bacteroidales bacterium]